MYCMDSANIYGFAENGFYFQRTSGRRLSSDLHCHTFYEFLYIVSGECVHEKNGIEDNVSAGDLIFIAPGSTHRFLSQSDNSDVIALSVVRDEMLPFLGLYNDLCNKSFTQNLSIEKSRILLEQCERITFENNDKYILQLRVILNQILIFGLEPKYKDTAVPAEFSTAIKKMEALENASEGISAFLRLSGYSHSQLCRLTKKYLGMTPTDYVNQIRMNHAYDMIVYSDKDYETICDSVGIESFSYFCKLLKEHFGCSASKLRKGIEIMKKTI